MKRVLLIFLPILISGCAQISYSKVSPDGTRTSAAASSLFSNTAIKGFNADSATEKTKTGLKFSTSDTSPDAEALGAVIGAAVKAAK